MREVILVVYDMEEQRVLVESCGMGGGVGPGFRDGDGLGTEGEAGNIGEVGYGAWELGYMVFDGLKGGGR